MYAEPIACDMQARLAAAMPELLRVGQRVGLAVQCLHCTSSQQTQVSCATTSSAVELW